MLDRSSQMAFTRVCHESLEYRRTRTVGLHFMYYNFGRIHKTLRVTPVMEAGVSNHVRSLEEIAKLAD